MRLFKLPIGLMLAFTLLVSTVVPANAGVVTTEEYRMESKSMQEIFDRFHYAMNVEWDQKDPTFIEQAEKDLMLALDQSGVSIEELQSFLINSVVKGEAGKDLKRLIASLREADISSDKAGQIAADYMEKSYAEGASFSGKGHPKHGHWGKVITVIVVVVIVTVIMKHGQNDHDHDHDHECNWSWDQCH